MGSMIFMIVIIALMIAMMWGSSRKSKQQQAAVQDFRQSLQPGDEVATTTGLLGKVVSVDLEKEQVVIDSEGSQSRWRIQAITQPPIVPAYVHDDEVDENGNPLPEQVEGQSEDADAPAEVTAAEDGDNADDTATQNFAASEGKDDAQSKSSDSEPEQEDESDKARTAEKSDDAADSDASKDSAESKESEASDSTSAKS
ncbi:preprotein translocase subunit YajC [Bifidobacterium sp. W8101]|uniref:preprotein translocase subunit YajC n=1 Tax=Bifidobacterium TaxID=1678 RepID=UPI0018DE1DFD|nr:MULTISPECIES: preprotein translocase subunit YajC [Bifidobacterium]MBI0127013.1 preprotein translocase subunit YajC [Bifidobacterium choladohabitans]MBI0128582.1 preprotein translocase subunit YajC [Bifidobacterium sp. W8103]MBI0139045.1 preprotein translocase subunit YajC [Bifidobacterium sp. W8105]MBI0149409.1 preprotein translocase subunit YajC [Bifidobacterium sp. W8107]